MTATIDPQLAYILEHPDDDTARLIYADHLEEQGEAARAEFIRVSIELTKVRSKCGSESGDYLCRSLTCPLCPLIRRMNVAWLEMDPVQYPFGRIDAKTIRHFAFRIPFGPDQTLPVAHFQRGFIEILHCFPCQWIAIADDATTRHPIREVHLERRGDSQLRMPDDFDLEYIKGTGSKRWPQIKFRWPAN